MAPLDRDIFHCNYRREGVVLSWEIADGASASSRTPPGTSSLRFQPLFEQSKFLLTPSTKAQENLRNL